jgi:glutamine cyclotransferase
MTLIWPLLFSFITGYGARIVHTYPHDRSSFTQGLEYRDGLLYEGTGLKGQSKLRVERLETGEIVRQLDVPAEYFGEGITVFGNRIFQLTWQAQVGFVYGRSTFRPLGRFHYPGEGWGLTNDGKHVYMSDGSAQIRCLDPANLRELRRITVHDGARTIPMLNELECVDGEIYANVWQTERIVRFRPIDGMVTGWIDASGLLTAEDQREPVDVLNGIAYDAAGKRLFVTGKLWPKLFEIQLVAR